MPTCRTSELASGPSMDLNVPAENSSMVAKVKGDPSWGATTCKPMCQKCAKHVPRHARYFQSVSTHVITCHHMSNGNGTRCQNCSRGLSRQHTTVTGLGRLHV
jgi:hypothetical protein